MWTDYLWFDSVGFKSVWLTNVGTSIGLAVAGVLVAFGFLWLNILLTDRTAGRFPPLAVTPGDEIAQRFREWAEPRIRRLRVVVVIFFALVLGVGVTIFRDAYLIFRNPTPFGVADPQFGTDLSFFIFRLPFLGALVGWVVNLTVVALLLVAVLSYLNGGLRFRRRRMTTPTGVKAHLSGLLALLALLQGVRYRLSSYELLIQTGDRIGTGYVDVNARLPAYTLLIVVSVLAAVLLVVNVWRPGWTLAAVSVGSWAFVAVAAGLVYPAVVQRFQVSPNELARERPYIERSIAGTRAGFGLSDVTVRTYSGSSEIGLSNVDDNRLTLDNLRLWDPDVLDQTYQSLQEIRSFYRVDRVDTDRYVIDGEPTQVMVSPRELDEEGGIPADWQNQRLIYTHGYGAVLSPANGIASDGQPDLLIRDVPPKSSIPEITIDEPRIYFGESSVAGKPVIVKTGETPQEVDYPLAQGTAPNEYDGAAGVGVGSIVRRAAFALRFQELNILISSQIRADSEILLERNIREIVHKVAPFAAVDADPYPVILDGRILWVLDLYTISGRYPYSQPATRTDTARLPVKSDLPLAGFNYIRNSVKATIDAYDGTVRIYVVDPTDPIVQTWQYVYPELMLDDSEMPDGLQEHFRYPQELFKVQSEKYLQYHVANVDEFFRGVDAWSVPLDPSTTKRVDLVRGDSVGAIGSVDYFDRLMPYYVMLRLPEEDDLSYVLMQPFTPLDKPNMSSFLAADSTPGRYGRLVDYRFPRGSLVEGTEQVANRIDQNDQISSQFTLWRGQGSTVVLGDMLIVPIDGSILYVQPVYLVAEREGLPELRRVVVVHGNEIGWAPTFGGALDAVFGTGGGGSTVTPSAPVSGTVEELLAEAAQAFTDARAALQDGDLAEYQRLVEKAESLVEEALGTAAPAEEPAPEGTTTTTVPEVKASFERSAG